MGTWDSPHGTGDHERSDNMSTTTPKKTIDLGFCPRCKSDFHEGGEMMTRVVSGVKFCWLCSFEVEDDRLQRRNWVSWARDYAKNMM